MVEETKEQKSEQEPQKQKFEGEFEKFNDAECSADGRVYVKEGELYIPELGVVCYGAGPYGKPSQELDTVMPCYHTAYIKTSDGKVYSRKDYKDVKKLSEFFNSHGKTLRNLGRTSEYTPASESKPKYGESKNENPDTNSILDEKYKPVEVINLSNHKDTIEQRIPEKHEGLEAVVQEKLKKLNDAPIKSASYEPKEEKKPEKKVKRTGKIVEFPDEGTLFVATDLHGDMDALEKVIAAFEKKYAENVKDGKKTYLLTLGDDIHKDPKEYEVSDWLEYDDSYKIIDRFDDLKKKYGSDCIIPLMGNHEMAHLGIKELQYAVKDNVDQVRPFQRSVKRDKGEEAIEKYMEEFRERPLMAITSSGLIFAHSGPTRNVTLEQIRNVEYSKDYRYLLQQLIINRIHDGLTEELDYYLKKEEEFINSSNKMLESFNANALILGHTPPTNRFFFETAKTRLRENYACLGDNVLIFNTGKLKGQQGRFLEIELGRRISIGNIINGI